MSDQIESFVEAQKDLLRGYCKTPADLNLGARTTYYSQRDNYTMPNRSCNSSSNAMYLDWLRRATGREALGGDNAYLRKVLSIGDTVEHTSQTEAIKQYGFSTKWREDGSEDRVFALLAAGFPVVVNILHRNNPDGSVRGGHVIMLIGRRSSEDTLIAHDPYGTLESDYVNTNGAFSRISLKQFDRRWQGGFRTLAS
jgi:hypothetical protein